MSDVPTYTCGQCHYNFNHGAHVCQGCRGTIVYGATQREVSEAQKLWGFSFGLIALIGFHTIPMYLNSSFNWSLPTGTDILP